MAAQNKIYYQKIPRGDTIKKLARTVILVTALSVTERFLGFIYRIYLSRTIGSEGLGVYQIALTVFGLLLTITSSGIPITVSRMMTRYKANSDLASAHSTVTSGIVFSLLLSAPIVLFFFVLGGKLSFIFSDPRSFELLLIILPGLIVTSVYAVVRGAFWGNKDFLSYGIIELMEEAVMIVAGVLLINFATSSLSGMRRAAWAVVISYVFSFAAGITTYFIKGGKLRNPAKTFLPLASSSAPITGMRTATSLINSLIAVILPARLIAFGMSQAQAVSQFGAAFGMAVPILFMPATLIGSLAVVLVPELSENFYKRQTQTLKNNIEKALRFSFFISCMIFPVLFAFGENFGRFFYDSVDAGKYLSCSAIVVLPMSITMISTSMLNSMNMERKTLIFYLSGASFMMICIFFLPKFIGIHALAVGMIGQFAITAVLNLAALNKKMKANLGFLGFALKSFIFTLPAALLGTMTKNVLSRFLSDAATCFVGGALVAAFNFTLYLVFGMVRLPERNGKRYKKATA